MASDDPPPADGDPRPPDGGPVPGGVPAGETELLGPAQIREAAERLGIRPTKQLGQNFVVDANTVRRIVRLSGVDDTDHVLEIGPGLGSLTLALLPGVASLAAVEIDAALAVALPDTVAAHAPRLAGRLTVHHRDALGLDTLPDPQPSALVANLPYNVAVPVLLRCLEVFPTVQRALVMVQMEVAERLCAPPGSRTYGVPSVKTAWYADARLAGAVSRQVFWPVPRVDSGLVALTMRPPPQGVDRREVFACVDAAFAQRRKTLRSALASWAGSADAAESACRAAGIDPGARGEQLDVHAFAALVGARRRGIPPASPAAHDPKVER